MSDQLTTGQLDQQISQLPLREQLRLAANICERLSTSSPIGSSTGETKVPAQYPKNDIDELLAMCEAAAQMWEGDFDSVTEIRQLRQERDEQVWLNR